MCGDIFIVVLGGCVEISSFLYMVDVWRCYSAVFGGCVELSALLCSMDVWRYLYIYAWWIPKSNTLLYQWVCGNINDVKQSAIFQAY